MSCIEVNVIPPQTHAPRANFRNIMLGDEPAAKGPLLFDFIYMDMTRTDKSIEAESR